MNVGFALGALVAGTIARTDDPSTFTFLFLLNAVTFIVFVAVLQFLPAPRHREAHHEPGRYKDVFRHRVFIAFIVLNVIFIGGGIALMSELLPPFAKNTARVSEPAIGMIWFVFSAGVALGQLPIVKLVEEKRRMRGLALMGVVWAGTFVAVTAGGAWLTGNEAAVVFGFAVGALPSPSASTARSTPRSWSNWPSRGCSAATWRSRASPGSSASSSGLLSADSSCSTSLSRSGRPPRSSACSRPCTHSRSSGGSLRISI